MNEEIVGIIFGTSMLPATILAFYWGRAHLRRTERAAIAPPPVNAEVLERLDRMEQAIDAVAIEVERISEGQRFTNRLMSEQAPREALPAKGGVS